jgi:nucleoside-diphosphate-sugar epimerase
MRVAVTGGSGFTGRFVVEALKSRGLNYLLLDADLCDRAAVDRAVQENEFDCVLHLAARAFVDDSDWTSFYTVNQIGTFNLLDAVASHRPGARCIISSSAQVYGPGAEGLITEDTQPRPSNHYAISKLAMEQGAALWRSRLTIVVTRPFNYTGLGQSTQYLIPKIVDHYRRKAEVIELGNTWVKRDFGDVRSVAEAYLGLLLADNPPQVLNISTGVVWSIDEILAILSRISGHSIKVRVNPSFARANEVPVLGGDAARLKEALPLWALHDLADTLEWMFHA